MAKQFEEQLQEEINSEFLFEAFRDTQNKLNIITKNTNTTLPRFITVSRLPSPELFMPSLEEELAQKDITDEERQAQAEAERKAQEEAEAKAKAEEEARLEAERLAKEEEERKAREEEEARLKAEEEARLEAERLEQERIEAEKKAQEEAEAQAKAEEEAEEQPAEEAVEEQPEVDEAPEETVEEPSEEPVVEEQPAEETSIEEPQVEEQEVEQEEPVVEETKEEPAPQPVQEEQPKVEEKPIKKAPPQQEQISVISFATLKGKKKPIAKMSTMQAGGIAAAKMEHDKQKEELIAIRKEEAAARAEQRKIEREKEALERLPNAILIGNTKAPSPELGKFEIASSKDADRPFRLLLRTEKGQVVFETSPMKTKPNELTAVMFKDIMNTGSFTFTRSINGFAFQILDSRKRVFYSSRSFINLNDAKRAAAMIKKYGLSANYIDDTTI